ncbi:hypothetical protein JT05_06605 [Desulfosporosinus sp. Tol-M]|nr:hypothetical protein JT05_06605 [Desulfosporosinus sp. Tol-M]
MSNFTYPVLCGGTFFTLVLEARNQRTSRRSQYAGELDGLSQPETLAGLGSVVYPEYTAPKNKDTFSTNASDYKSCENNGTNLSFLFDHEVAAFDNRVKTQYLEALKAMDDFIKRFLEIGTSTAREVWLVRAFLDLINADQSIADNQEFYIAENGQGITKAALRGMSDFCLQTFLLGVWHFVIVNRQDNKVGKATYDTWCPSRGRAERKYTGPMGDGITRPINVTLLEMLTSEIEQETAAAVEDEPSAEYGEAFVKDATEDASSKTTNQTVNNPSVFNQYGSNSIQIGSIGTITINNSGGGKSEQ